MDVLDQLWFRKPIRQHVKEFGQLFGLIGFAAAAYCVYVRAATPWAIGFGTGGLIFLGLGYAAPRVLHPVWKGWMKFADVLGLIVNCLILFVAWVLMFIPVGLGLRLFGKYVMDLRYKADVESYWEERDPRYDDFKRLERQF